MNKPPLPAWLVRDSRNNLHIDIPLLLVEFGWPDTPANRDLASEIALNVCAEVFPGVPRYETTGRLDRRRRQ